MDFLVELEELQRQLAQVDLFTTHLASSRAENISFLLAKKESLKFKMYQEPGHGLPHVHVDYGKLKHTASYQINPPLRLAGNLSVKYERTVLEWISSRREVLLQLWLLVQSGGDHTSLVYSLSDVGANDQ